MNTKSIAAIALGVILTFSFVGMLAPMNVFAQDEEENEVEEEDEQNNNNSRRDTAPNNSDRAEERANENSAVARDDDEEEEEEVPDSGTEGEVSLLGGISNDDFRAVWLTTRTSAVQETWSNSALDSGDLIVYHFGNNPLAGPNTGNNQLQDLADVTSVPDHRKGLEFFSLELMEEWADEAAALDFGFLSYDLENGESPSAEVADPLGSIEAAKAITDAAGLELMVAPSNAISTNHADDIALILEDGDRYHLQSQPRQDDDTDCTDMIEWINARITEIEGANPALTGEITAQTTITGNPASGKTPEQTSKDCIDAAITTQGTVINGHADGVTIFWGGSDVNSGFTSGDYIDAVAYYETNYS